MSVIIPMYERLEMTIDALNSVWHQSYRPIEVILVDDGSPGDIEGPIKNWNAQTINDDGFSFQYIRLENAGAPTARNHGVRQSTGEFIQFLDNDDLLGRDKLEQQVRKLLGLEAQTAVYAESNIFYDNNGTLRLRRPRNPNPEHTLHNWLSGHAIHPHSILWQREDICRLGPWREDLKANQDGEYAMRFLLSGGRLLHCPASKVYYRIHNGGPISISKSTSHSANESRFSVFDHVEKQLVAASNIAPYQDALAKTYLRMAPKFAENSPELVAACFNKAARLSPNTSFHSVLPKHYSLAYRVLGMKIGDRILQAAQRWKHRYLTGLLPGYTTIADASTLYGSPRDET